MRLSWAMVAVAYALIVNSCVSARTSLDTMSRDVQNCILAGGHARLGPDQTVICLE